MNKSKMIEDMETTIGEALGLTYEGESLPFSLHTRNYLAKELVNASYRKVTDDEIVITNDEYKKLRSAEYDALTYKSEVFKIALEKIEQAKKDTIREILQIIDGKLDLYRNGVIGGTPYDAGYKSAINEIKIAVKSKYGYELE